MGEEGWVGDEGCGGGGVKMEEGRTSHGPPLGIAVHPPPPPPPPLMDRLKYHRSHLL